MNVTRPTIRYTLQFDLEPLYTLNTHGSCLESASFVDLRRKNGEHYPWVPETPSIVEKEGKHIDRHLCLRVGETSFGFCDVEHLEALAILLAETRFCSH